MGLNAFLKEPFEKVPVNVYDVNTKTIVFTGGQKQAAKFIGTSQQNISMSLRLKTIIKKKYTVRLAKKK